MKRAAVLAACALIGLSCGGGSGAPGGMIGGGLLAAFDADQPNPPNASVTLASGAGQGDSIIVRVDVTGISGLRSAGFDLLFDATAVEFVGSSAGTALESSGLTPIYVASESSPGLLTVGIDLPGPGAVDIPATRTLINLAFRVRQAGSFPLTFHSELLRDATLQPISASWHAGTLTAG